MTHEPETTFTEHVAEWLADAYPDATIESNAYLGRTGRYADYVVAIDRPDGVTETLTVEVENDFEAVFEGIAQAGIYAEHYADGRPVVAVPADHTESPEWEMLGDAFPQVTFLEIPYDNA